MMTHNVQMVDVGCGIGGSSRHIARKYGCSARGLTLSPVQVRRCPEPHVTLRTTLAPAHVLLVCSSVLCVQAARANQLASDQGLADRVSFEVGDALQQPFPAGELMLVLQLQATHSGLQITFHGDALCSQSCCTLCR